MSNHINHSDLVLFDLDMTLVDTSTLQSLRRQRKWSEVYSRTSESRLLYDPKDKEMQELMKFGPKDCAGIVTSSPRTYAQRICNYHNIDIPVLCAYHDTRKHKPHPEPIYYACEQVGIDPKKTTYIGDSIDDMHSILNAGGVGVYIGPKLESVTVKELNLIEDRFVYIPKNPLEGIFKNYML